VVRHAGSACLPAVMRGVAIVERVATPVRAFLLLGALCLLAPVSARAALAHASLNWSAQPTFLNAGMGVVSPGLDSITCPSASECVAVDVSGREVSFDPSDPSGWSAYEIDGHHQLTGVSCPALAQCTAVDAGGEEVTFDPATGAVGSRVVIDPQARAAIGDPGGQALTAVACPSASVCVAVDSGGQAISFAPGSPSGVRTAALTGGRLPSVACPASGQCTVLAAAWTAPDGTEHGASAITVDPSSLAVESALALPATASAQTLVCPTTGECVGAGYGGCDADTCQDGATVTFAPLSAAAPIVAERGSVGLISVACPTSSLCAAMDDSGAVATFDPASAGDTAQAAIDPLGDWPKGFNGAAIACPSVQICALATWNEPAALTFSPQSPAAPVPVAIDDGAPIFMLACPVSDECVGLAPTQPKDSPGPLDIGAVLGPGSQRHATGFRLLNGDAEGLACPRRRQCTVIAGAFDPHCPSCMLAAGSSALTFNPYRPPRYSQGVVIDPARIEGLACPTARQCTAVDDHGRELSFDPNRLGSGVTSPQSSTELTAVACPTARQCTAVDADGNEFSFVPHSGAPISAGRIDGTHALTSVACPAAAQCTAVDRLGDEVTFDPRGTIARARRTRIDHAALTGIACPSGRFCVAVDSAGFALTGDPRTTPRWTLGRVPGASTLLAVACPSIRECVVTDAIGNAFEAGVHARGRPRLPLAALG